MALANKAVTSWMFINFPNVIGPGSIKPGFDTHGRPDTRVVPPPVLRVPQDEREDGGATGPGAQYITDGIQTPSGSS